MNIFLFHCIYLLKGMLGRILFAWKYGTSLDYEAKTWRLVAGKIIIIEILF